MYEVPVPGRIHSDEGQLQWLDLLLGCLQEGDRAFAANDLKKMCTNPQCRLLYDKTKKEAKEANQKMFTEVNERKHETKELERKCEETLASHEGLVKVNSILKSEMVREKEKLQQFEMSLSENEKIAKHAMEMYKQRELELEKKLKSKELHIETIVENLQETEKTARREVERLQTEKDDEKERAEKEKQSLSAEMTKKLASKQQHVDTLTETVREKERNETTLRQQVEELKKGREEDRARAEKDKRSLAADMTKKLESKQQHVDTLTETVGEKERNETTLTKQVEELRKGKEEDRARAEKDIRSIELSWKKEHDSKEQLLEQLEREIWKLRTKIQLESEMRAAEQKKKAETHDWSLIHWMISGKQAQGEIQSTIQIIQNISFILFSSFKLTSFLSVIKDKSSFEDNSTGGLGRSDTLQSGEEPPDDEFAGILQQIADDLYDEAKIDSLAGQLGILHGDIQRALMTNVKFNRVTSDGTRHILKQWRRGVSREDERIELTKALHAAKLVNLADLYLSEGVAEGQIDSECANEDDNDQQLSNTDDTSLEQDRTKRHTDIQVLQGATAISNHTPRDSHTGNMAAKAQENVTDGSRSQHIDQSPERSTEDLDESEVTSEEVSSEEVHPGEDMNNVSSIQP
ncbi:myosin heavy chain, non-muscle-like [Strongylocentrotus purpuratus]|uniref:Death domain-containing protein n=1 Tax=Strongylocentrotus purpuratus TaxID=7668 RepID=A0A7M7PQZ4_STRPU|nr:myosin heavy chain, non-muscle-like [Strongylocentrotus purpuratus]